MPYPVVSRLLAAVRRKMGTEGLHARLDLLAERLGQVEARLGDINSPGRGPVYLGGRRAVVATEWGGVLVVDTGDLLLAPALLLYRHWEPELTAWFRANLGEGQTFVDVGANIGYYSVLGGRLVGPGGRVVAVEAHPELVELLRHNVVINGLGFVTVWHRAAWSEPAKLDFHLRANFAANSSVGSLSPAQLEVHADAEDVVSVEAVPLDELLADLDRVDVLKVDIEGSEIHAFVGLEKTLRRCPDLKVVFEWSPGQIEMVGGDPPALLELLQGHGLRFFHIENALAAVGAETLLALRHANVLATRSVPASR